MTREEMLDHVFEDASDFHDGLDGWFGFDVSDGELTVSFSRWNDETGEGDEPLVYRWRLIEVDD